MQSLLKGTGCVLQSQQREQYISLPRAGNTTNVLPLGAEAEEGQ